jgi:hypothetical protein
MNACTGNGGGHAAYASVRNPSGPAPYTLLSELTVTAGVRKWQRTKDNSTSWAPGKGQCFRTIKIYMSWMCCHSRLP